MAVTDHNGCFVHCLLVGLRWSELQCNPVFSGNFTPSGHTVKVTTLNKVARMDGFTFVVRNVEQDDVMSERLKKKTKTKTPSVCGAGEINVQIYFLFS